MKIDIRRRHPFGVSVELLRAKGFTSSGMRWLLENGQGICYKKVWYMSETKKFESFRQLKSWSGHRRKALYRYKPALCILRGKG